jgi:hypothetical protein
MKVALLTVVCLVSSFRFVHAQELRTEPVTAEELAAKLNIYIEKFQAKFTEPVFATVLLREGNAVSSFETTKPAKEFAISFESMPSEIAIEKPRQISFRGNVTGKDGVIGTFASTNRGVSLDARFSREGFSVGNPYLWKLAASSGGVAESAQLPLDEEICLFEYRLDGKIEKTPTSIKVQGCILFSKSPKKKD